METVSSGLAPSHNPSNRGQRRYGIQRMQGDLFMTLETVSRLGDGQLRAVLVTLRQIEDKGVTVFNERKVIYVGRDRVQTRGRSAPGSLSLLVTLRNSLVRSDNALNLYLGCDTGQIEDKGVTVFNERKVIYVAGDRVQTRGRSAPGSLLVTLRNSLVRSDNALNLYLGCDTGQIEDKGVTVFNERKVIYVAGDRVQTRGRSAPGSLSPGHTPLGGGQPRALSLLVTLRNSLVRSDNALNLYLGCDTGQIEDKGVTVFNERKVIYVAGDRVQTRRRSAPGSLLVTLRNLTRCYDFTKTVGAKLLERAAVPSVLCFNVDFQPAFILKGK
ncbi:hypothetical protein J6590_014222 [Homalodisca vitripennis]|nr:hypothetical protein J6590_014222 [Homalodisca vitripennis]